jgi:hypothetical protein|tara:strand:+ start:34 stop:477 length:444 start_codon:yes stop_codon:yes gene_type:complete
MTTNFFLIKTDDVENIWFGVKPLIQKALDHAEGALTTTDVLKLVLNGNQNLWVGLENNDIFSAMITEVISYPRHKILRIITYATVTGHGMDEWYDGMIEKLEDFGRAKGCVGLEAWCRKGFTRKLDWDHTYAVVYKRIKPKLEVLNE